MYKFLYLDFIERMMTEPTAKYSDSQGYKFGKSSRSGVDKRMTPGPGTY